ncbi:MAG: hypothetical protein ACREAB_02845 [Blastocatellia bacterium]
MNNPAEPMKPSRARTWVAYGAIFLLLATSVVIALAVNRQPRQLQADQVLNKTSVLEVVSVAPGQNNTLVVTVKNVSSNKNITGLVFKSEDIQVETDFISGFGDYTIPPGKTYSRVILPNTKAAVEASDVSILAAVLDDRSINGDTETGQRLLDRRKGKKEQLQLILPAMKAAIDSKAVNMVAQTLADIDKIPHPHDLEMQPHLKAGAHSIRELVLSKIQDQVNRGVSSSAEDTQALNRIYDEYSRLLAKL